MEKAGLESRLFYVSFIKQVDKNFFSWELFPMTIITHILVYDAPFPTSWETIINKCAHTSLYFLKIFRYKKRNYD